MVKNISILGSTGSIGTAALDVISRHSDKFNVVGLTAYSNISKLVEQIHEYSPEIVCVQSNDLAIELRKQISKEVEIVIGEEGLCNVASYSKTDVTLTAVVGIAGLKPTIEALKAKKDIALANKETLVVAGQLIKQLAKENNCRLLPVDSEHSAIFQCLNGENAKSISKIIVTASGGAFRDKTREEMKSLNVDDALKHPNWSMGDKVTVDCATLMNKGFEVMEAHWFFDVPYDDIEVLIHKESVIHSLIEFNDGSVLAQLGVPDMRGPIQYALNYPNGRLDLPIKKLDLLEFGKLHFEAPDNKRFPCLQFAYEVGKQGGTYPAVLNAANEVANELFRKRVIDFLEIEKTIRTTLDAHDSINDPNLEQILQANEWARKYSFQVIENQLKSKI
ncbi:1-deoxy-D-xylulose-5-phosphate reductoisomerase [Bacillus solimangrovi]|uniref:1-deoxy-D-xylulose 5-phosphate reductoisomerase n=1 Tax=Bacillus solimangrovi TaxID=1305675 RepID=A0A1E5LK94_9BACI|nr:1-deoxy-D-xylulose-5-phosphate reductoisomerase [Bacillus solimangrovi]OEH94448.1 1-deoxy-D-xylulose-5-phosphate reductoisomerase [Bacillus solimangrovi]